MNKTATQAAGEAQMYDRLASVFCLLEDCVAQGIVKVVR